MAKIIKFSRNYWKQASILSILVFCGVWYFTIGFGPMDKTVQVALGGAGSDIMQKRLLLRWGSFLYE